jgi:hypothetical protein
MREPGMSREEILADVDKILADMSAKRQKVISDAMYVAATSVWATGEDLIKLLTYHGLMADESPIAYWEGTMPVVRVSP